MDVLHVLNHCGVGMDFFFPLLRNKHNTQWPCTVTAKNAERISCTQEASNASVVGEGVMNDSTPILLRASNPPQRSDRTEDRLAAGGRHMSDRL